MKTVPVYVLDVEIASLRRLAAENLWAMRSYRKSGINNMADWHEGRAAAHQQNARHLKMIIDLYAEEV